MRASEVLALLLLAAGSTQLPADTSTATITGTVTDSSGAVLSGALVKAQDLDIGVSRSTLTNQSGVYLLLGLQAGNYEILASSPRFATAKRAGVVLRVNDEVRIDLSLTPGETRESVVVTESAGLVQTESSAASAVVNERAIQDLPNDGRQLQNLALIVPGVSAGWNLSTAANRYGKARENTEGAFNVNGARSRSNDFLFDGMPMNLRQYSVINFEPSNEAVQEFDVVSSTPPAEFGRTMGGQISVVTRAGSSHYHGAGYEFFRNDALNANDTLTKRAGLPRGEVRHHQFGGSLGGPIWKQKHFFFVNTELLRNLEASQSRTVNVPTDGERRGQIPYTDGAGAQRVLDLSSRITPVSARLMALYPQPNSSLPDGNYNAALAIGLHDYQYHVRTDHHFTECDIVTMRSSWNLNDQIYLIDLFGGPYIPGFTLPNPERTTNGTIGYTHVFGAQLMNEARLGVNRYGNILANGDQRNAANFGLPNGSSANGIPSISFAQGGLANLGGLSWYNREQDELTVYASDTVSLLRGAHSVKLGAEGSRYHFNTRGADNQRGTIFFDGSRNSLIPKTAVNAEANALTDLLLGLPYEATITVGQFGRGYREWAWAAFAQDSWRATRRLTLDYGVRYEYSAPWTEVNGKLSNFVPGLGLVSQQSPGWPGLYRPDRNNFGPRFGFAYDLTGKSRTVVRGGFGMLYETLLQASTVQQIENNAPYSAAAVTTAPTPFAQDNSPSRTLLDLRGSAEPSRSLAAIPLDLRNPYTMQFSLDAQQALGQGWVVELGYRATRGVRLPFDYDINQVPLDTLTAGQRSRIAAALGSPAGTAPVVDPLRPFPGFNSIALYTNSANSIYHSLQFKVERRFHAGLNLLAGYAWSKSIDNASDFGSGDASESVLDSRNLRAQRALSSFNVPHRLTASFNYVPPEPRVRALRQTLGGWQLNGVITIQSGQPFTPYTSQFDPYTNQSFNRLNVIGDPRQNAPAGHAYNPSAFALPAVGSFGASGRNIIVGDGYRGANLSLFRNFALRESVHLQIRLEAENSLNQVNYQGPITDQSTTPALFVATAPPRLVQLGAKISF
jgi:Carboxypeptidase regulatory-like domain/TonB-dependent Receptor Plug Domain/TonB dependent receptor